MSNHRGRNLSREAHRSVRHHDQILSLCTKHAPKKLKTAVCVSHSGSRSALSPVCFMA